MAEQKIDFSQLVEKKSSGTEFSRFWCATCGRESKYVKDIVECDHKKKYPKNLKEIEKAVKIK